MSPRAPLSLPLPPPRTLPAALEQERSLSEAPNQWWGLTNSINLIDLGCRALLFSRVAHVPAATAGISSSCQTEVHFPRISHLPGHITLGPSSSPPYDNQAFRLPRRPDNLRPQVIFLPPESESHPSSLSPSLCLPCHPPMPLNLSAAHTNSKSTVLRITKYSIASLSGKTATNCPRAVPD